MAKVRVYELAKDLNMTNRALLNKMKELKIKVKSHMSSLEDSDVRAIKQSLFGKAKRNSDVKVRPSVIRRRKQKTETDDVEEIEESAGAVSEAGSEVQPGEISGDKTDRKVVIRKKKIVSEDQKATPKDIELNVSDDAPEEPKEIESSKQTQKTEPEAKKASAKPKKKKAVPAKIIRPGKIEEEVTKEVESEKSVADSKESPTPVIEEPAAQEKEDKPEKAEILSDKEQLKKSEIEPEEKSAKVPEKEASQVAKKKKKKKKSTPAKIVRVIDPATLRNIKKSGGQDDKKRNGPKGGQKDNAKKPAHKKPERPKSFSNPGSQPGRMNPPPIGVPAPVDLDTGKRKKGVRKEGFSDNKPVGKKRPRKRKSVIEGDALYRGRGRKRRGRKDTRGKKGNFQKTQITTPKAIKRRIKIDDAIELAELAKRMGIKANEMIAKLMTMGVMATVNQTIDYETATLVAAEFDFEVEKASFEEETLLNIDTGEEDEGNLVGRPPVVTIMGHVDHGKTSLLDVIRESKITSGEAGGITQHIGAYNVQTGTGGRITFLDTPGHAAFTSMRSRGARITDIVILVVAADDGVMPQTIEAINHSKAAGVPVMVAVNKMDKEGADPDRIMRELSELDLLAEDWGGNVIFVKVSAKTGMGINDLLEMVSLQSEVLELKANPDRKATGYVVESRLDTGRGAVATVLVKQGTLKDGDPVVCGLHSGRIRAMIDDGGKRIEAAGPSVPVEIVGLTGVPDAGDEFIAVASDKDAKQIAGNRMQKQRAKELAKKSRANLQKMFENLGSAEVKELKLIVKADVHGSIEALNDSLKDLAKEEVEIKIVHSGTGTINESDVAL
ncbi:MAG: translation initiation factor IF-2, partial [Desulfobacula sp.]|nr:translation initiation factor IF-2 [Desulfobacula sp.]